MSLVKYASARTCARSTPTNVVYDVFPGAGLEHYGLQINFDTPITKAKDWLEAMRFWEERWNGYDISAPNPAAIDLAIVWIERMYESILAMSKSDKSKGWVQPHITASEHGDVVFEWWNDDKGLSIYVSETEVSYIKDWGVNIQDEMEDGTLSTYEDVAELWSWMFGPPAD